MTELIKSIGSLSKLIVSIPSILGLISSLICYKFFSKDWWWLIMSYLVILLIGKCSTTLWKVYWQWRNHRANVRYYKNRNLEKETKEQQQLKDNIKIFFLTLSDRNLNMLMEVYRYQGESTGYSNERIISSVNSQCFYYITELTQLEFWKISNEQRFIVSNNENFDNTSPRHIWFHPYLYAIMENYAINGVKDYPQNFKP